MEQDGSAIYLKSYTECISLNHHLVNVVALRALKRAEVETHTCGHDASEQHASMALWASGAMDLDVDIVRQEIGFSHDAFPLRRRERNTLCHREYACGAVR